eukprot:CAMPEP_0185260594 /NCGR_PEP_ID=MMETSP1359-20130426/9172_1 /TAXON_ID=552665 /ORGANISM="Bigelowiella longifila, Strain CCMP242" /LENGTH=486 /DNA_ID=CAMNT_0027846937 /DNA_START=53 /DNA_END=1510 /DNA_ORIENTATION=-
MIDPITGLPLEEEISSGEEGSTSLAPSATKNGSDGDGEGNLGKCSIVQEGEHMSLPPSSARNQSDEGGEGGLGECSAVQDNSSDEDQFLGGGFCVSDDDGDDPAPTNASKDSETKVVKSLEDGSGDRCNGSATESAKAAVVGNRDEGRGVESDSELCGLTEDEEEGAQIEAEAVASASKSYDDKGGSLYLTDEEENEVECDEKKESPREVGTSLHGNHERDSQRVEDNSEGKTGALPDSSRTTILQEAEEARKMFFGGALLMNEGRVGTGAGGFVADNPDDKIPKGGKGGGREEIAGDIDGRIRDDDIEGSVKRCCKCKKRSFNKEWHRAFGVLVCNKCKYGNPQFDLIPKSKAKQLFLVTDGELNCIGTISKPNPYKPSWAPMKLYLKSQVLEMSRERYEDDEALERERKTRALLKLKRDIQKEKDKHSGQKRGGYAQARARRKKKKSKAGKHSRSGPKVEAERHEHDFPEEQSLHKYDAGSGKW